MNTKLQNPQESTDEQVLRRIKVRPIRPQERRRWVKLMRRHHYLGWSGPVGESIEYVATLEGRWVALLAFGAPAYRLADRDAWIGWNTTQRRARLNFLAQNRRFLVLPQGRRPNLASRVLGQCAKRLSRDWEAKYGHPVFVLETFVDPQRFEGTCYRAAGWQVLGYSAGYRRAYRDFYLPEEHPKQLWVKALRRDAQALLCAERWPKAWQAHEKAVVAQSPVDTAASRSLWQAFAEVPEFRDRRGMRYRLPSVLACAACAVLAGAANVGEMAEIVAGFEQRHLRALRCWRHPRTRRYLAPSETTLRRVLSGIDHERFDSVVARWVQAQEPRTALALDGKALKGCLDAQGRPLFLVSAVTHGRGAFQGQVAVPRDSNETLAARALLAQLGPLDGVMVTADAAHTNPETARLIVLEQGGDYLLPLKSNQPTLLDIAQHRLPVSAFSPSGTNGRKEPQSH